jgi:hypothetical protein
MGRVHAKAMRDEAFRRSLIRNPRKALADAGFTLPAGVKVKVHQNSGSTVHLVLPGKKPRKKPGAKRPARPARMGPQFTIPI